MTKTAVTLGDKYNQVDGCVFMSAIQALVRLPIDQARRDRAAGLNTAGFVSGYRGSPLGTYDAALWAAQKLLDENEVTFLPALNEELAASSVRGTQELNWLGKSNHAGVFSLWYGKGVGTDRAMEALKLGNLEGAATHGGVLVLTGDDHGGKSSASAHQSEHTLIAAMIPILYPSTSTEIIEYGLAGWEMSRFSGAYVALKCVTDTLDFSSSVKLPDPEREFVRPDDVSNREGLGLQQLRPPLVQEELAHNHRLPAAQAFVRANGLDRTIFDSQHRNLGIIASGKAYLDVRQALDDLGLSEERCAALGVRLFKPAMIWPLEPEAITSFGRGCSELLVVEEKRPVIENQLVNLFYNLPDNERPVVTGKSDDKNQALLSSVGELTPTAVRDAIAQRLEALGLVNDQTQARIVYYKSAVQAAANMAGGGVARPAYYCSGCPHNRSTKLPNGSIAISAVGCHGLAAFMPERRTLMPMPMGGDGMPWVAAGPFVDTPHVFQNMGDGTYAHSGILSIRAAVAANSVMTFKILYNDAVAMTGGQPVEGTPSPLDIVRQLLAERVDPVVIVTDQPEDFTGPNAPPPGVSLYHRDQLNDVQERLRLVKGVSAIVYVQTCAAEKRRRRKRGKFHDPNKRIFINSAVCEGCGDCSVQSNCLSIQPLETELGRKRVIDQSSCNKDFSCVNGFCPSFVSVEGATIAKKSQALASSILEKVGSLAEPKVAGRDTVYSVLTTGIGGTGVLTIGAVLGMAAHLDGLGCTVMDQTGMAQKGGAVTSHLRVAPMQDRLHSARLDVATADLILACDMVVASSTSVLTTAKAGVTTAVLNSDVTPTGAFQTSRDFDVGSERLDRAIEKALAGGRIHRIHATHIANKFIGDSIASNFLMVGYALQMGLLPVSLGSVEAAIRLNGTNVNENLRVLSLGRLLAADPGAFEETRAGKPKGNNSSSLQERVVSSVNLLTDYQDETYAATFKQYVSMIADIVDHRNVEGSNEFTTAIAFTLARIMAYKDEYEVARLYTSDVFQSALDAQFDGDYRLKIYLSPPLFARMDSATGRPRKIAMGRWVLSLFKILRRMRRLRGTTFDPFGYTHERRKERRLILDYRILMQDVASKLTSENLGAAISLAKAAADIRGFGPVKNDSFEDYEARLPGLIAAFSDQPARSREPVNV